MRADAEGTCQGRVLRSLNEIDNLADHSQPLLDVE